MVLKHIGFHDCIIKQLEWHNKNLFLYFDWLDILETHPDNGTGKIKQTGKALVRFENVKILTSQWHDDSKALANAFEKIKKSEDTVVDVSPYMNFAEIEIKDIDFFGALRGLEIVSLDIGRIDEKYICKIDGYGLYENFQDLRDFCKNIRKRIEFEYSDAYIFFNNTLIGVRCL